MAQDYNLNFDINSNGVNDAEEKFLALGKSIDKARQELDQMRDSNQQGSVAFQQQKAELEQMESAFRDLNKEMKGVDATFEDVYGEVQPLTTALGEAEDRLYQLALAGDTTSKEYQELLDKVARYRKVQIQTDQVVDAAATTLSQKMGIALNGAASGFAAVQGAMGLFGVESEAVEETLLRVNSAMALAQGIEGVQEFSRSFDLAGKSTKAFALAQKGLNLILAANPFALIITAVVALIGYFAIFTDAISVIIDGLKSVSDFLGITDFEAEEAASKREREAEVQKQLQEQELKRQEELHNSRMSALDREIAVAKANGKDTTKLQKQKINEEIALRKAAMATLLVEQEKLVVLKDQFTAMASQGGIQGKVGQAGLAAIAKSESNVLELEEEIKNLENDLVILDIEFEKRRQTRNAKTKSDADKKAEDDAKKLEKEKEIELKRQRNLQKLRDDFETSLEAETDIANQRLISQQEFEIQAVQDKYFNLIEQAKQYGLDTQVLEENQQVAIDEIKKRFEDAETKRLDDKAKADEDRDRDLMNAKFNIAKDTLTLISGISQLFDAKNEEQAKRQFAIDKSLKIAEATTAGIQGVINAYKTAQASPITALMPAYPGIQAGLAGGFAALNIAKILKTKFNPSGSGGGGGDLNVDAGAGGGGGGLDTGAASATPEFNIVGDTGLSQLAEIQQQPTQAFVVSGDVTSAQSLDRNKIQNATI